MRRKCCGLLIVCLALWLIAPPRLGAGWSPLGCPAPIGGSPVFLPPVYAPAPAPVWSPPPVVRQPAPAPQQRVIRGVPPDEPPPQPRPVVYREPQAPPPAPPPAPVTLPPPEELGLAPARPAPAAPAPAGLSFGSARERLRELGSVGFQVQEVAAGGCRFLCWLSTDRPGVTHCVEACAATEAEAVRLGLERATEYRRLASRSAKR